MPIESATRAVQFNTAWPLSSDPRSEGDDHLRLIKSVAKTEAGAAEAQWSYTGHSSVYGAATRVRIDSDVSSTYFPGRRVRVVGSSTGTIYGNVSSATFSASTSVNFTFDSASTLVNEAVQISVSKVTPASMPFVTSFAQLRAISPSEGYKLIWVHGGTTTGDGGGGLFRWDGTATGTDDSLTLITPDAGGTGRWIICAPASASTGRAFFPSANVTQAGGTNVGMTVGIFTIADRGILVTGVGETRTPVLWGRTTSASAIPQMNVRGDNWEWGSGSAIDTVPAMTLDASAGNLTIIGALSKGSGTFRIDHPLKPDTHHLIHSFVEGPRCDLIYRGTATLVSGAASVDLDSVTGLTAGTFAALCRDAQVWVQNEDGWTAVKGSVSGATLSITCEDGASTDAVSWLVVAERQDDNIKGANWTDAEGRPILEPEKAPPLE
jgi:hypothetical protein